MTGNGSDWEDEEITLLSKGSACMLLRWLSSCNDQVSILRLSSTTSGSRSIGRSLNMTTGVVSRIPSTTNNTVSVAYALGTISFSLDMKVLAKHTLSNSEYMMVVGDSLIPTVSGDQIQYSVQGTLLKGLQLRWDTGRISERAEESFNRQSVPTVVSKEVGSVSFRLTKISYSFTLRKGKDYSLSPSFHGDSSSIQMGSLSKGIISPTQQSDLWHLLQINCDHSSDERR